MGLKIKKIVTIRQEVDKNEQKEGMVKNSNYIRFIFYNTDFGIKSITKE